MSGEVHGCKTCGGSHFGHNGCPFAEIAEASSKGETSAVTAAEKPEKESKAGSAETGGEKATPGKSARLAELRAIAMKATPGPWVGEWGCYIPIIATVNGKPAQIGRMESFGQISDQQVDDNAEFVSTFHPGTILDLLSELEGLTTNFPRSSQNQTVSSGVDGAHEGNTVDESVALAESSLSSPPPNSDSSAPTSPEDTGLSVEPAESRTPRETR